MTATTPDADAPPMSLAERDQRAVEKMKTVSGVLLLLLAATSFVAGIPGLVAAGEQAQLGRLAFLVPIVVDAALVLFALAALVLRAEGRRAVLAWTFVVMLTLISVGSQAIHALAGHGWQVAPESVTGAVVASLFPIVILGSTRTYEVLRFANLLDRQVRRAPGRNAAKAKQPAAARSNRPAGVVASAGPAPAVAPARPALVADSTPGPARPGGYTPEFKATAVARLANESERAVSADTKVSRSTLQSWKAAAA
jgi:hypothetical protein